MKIESIEWRNIFSYGNVVERVDYGKGGKLWHVCGKSGSGKTSFLSMPKLLLYGKTEGSDGKTMKVGSIANRINGNGWIKGVVSSGDSIYVIERTFSPNAVKVWKDGVEVSRASSKELQMYIESEILEGMPYNIFSNVLTLSLNNFKSFVSMTPADKRLIIDRVFSLDILNRIHELVKRDMKEVGNGINESKAVMLSLDGTIRMSNAELDRLSSAESDDELREKVSVIDSEVSRIDSDLLKLDSLTDEYSRKRTSMYEKCSEYASSVSILSGSVSSCMHRCSDIDSKRKLFSENRCPTCGTPFTGDGFDRLRDDLEKSYSEAYAEWKSVSDELERMKSSYNSVKNAVSSCDDALNKISSKRRQLFDKRNSILSERAMICETIGSSSDCESVRNIIAETEKKKDSIGKDVSKSEHKMMLLGMIEKLYSSDGIKSRIMDGYLPALNSEISETLSELGFPYSLEIDGNFDSHLKCFGEDIETQTLSVGEHKKVDIAVLCSVLKMIMRKFPNFNIVCLDETVSSLDTESSAMVLRYLGDMARDMKLNIFVVSHTSLDIGLFDVCVDLDKVNGFTVLKYR